MRQRIKCIDYLKTIAIISVLFFHMGTLTNGYLGVEVFFVISGYLFIRSNQKRFAGNEFHPVSYSMKKVSEFWPLIVIGGVVSLSAGYWAMLPDDFENLGESIVASNFFANNILQGITVKNYWNAFNTYRPLMHTWYIGVLLQTLIFLAFLLYGLNKITKKDQTKIALWGLFFISLALYLCPVIFSSSDKFYFIPFRMFEIVAGGLITYFPDLRLKERTAQTIGNMALFIILFIIFSGISLQGTISLLLIVFCTVIIIYTHGTIQEDYGIPEKLSNVLTLPGKYSYDVYIWHQIVIALLFYYFFPKLSLGFVTSVIVLTCILSVISAYVRKHVTLLSTIAKRVIFSSVVVVVTSAIGIIIYLNAGVFRNIPELGIDKTNIHRNMHAEYVDVPFKWNHDFETEDKIKIFVMGDSFGRDFANILNESEYSEQLEITYMYGGDASTAMKRVEEADFVFYGVFDWSMSDWILENVDPDKLYVIGNKVFGTSNGLTYVNRNKEGYFDQTFELTHEFVQNNYIFKGMYGDHYIDMIAPLLEGENRIRVFTDDHYFISQDCRHLTKNGAEYYSRILDLASILHIS